jgi:hypothetical protein
VPANCRMTAWKLREMWRVSQMLKARACPAATGADIYPDSVLDPYFVLQNGCPACVQMISRPAQHSALTLLVTSVYTKIKALSRTRTDPRARGRRKNRMSICDFARRYQKEVTF